MSAATQIELRASEYEARSAVELAFRDFRGETATMRGRYVAFVGGQVVVEVGGVAKRVDAERVRYLSPVDEMLHAASFHHGDQVRITKYGGQYIGSVAATLKTRLEVVFTTRGGKVKTQRIPAIECERVLRDRGY